MISLIICSRQPDISQSLKENIAKTIGIEYELIVIDNSKNRYSIFQAYNEGVRQAQYPYLCFMHDDVLYHTPHWGKKVVEYFQDEKVGLIGTFGTHFLPKTPSGWYQTKVVSGGGLVSVSHNGKLELECLGDYTHLKDQLSIEAVAVDGLWFCAPKSIFSIVFFDEQNFKGFHCYDIDICLQIRKAGFQVRIISDILLDHSTSTGKFPVEWVKNTLLLFEKWKEELPQVAGVDLSPIEMNVREDMVGEVFLWMSAYAQSSAELENIRQSKSYRLGKFVMKPLSFFKYKFK